jgi:hypothetical protein
MGKDVSNMDDEDTDVTRNAQVLGFLDYIIDFINIVIDEGEVANKTRYDEGILENNLNVVPFPSTTINMGFAYQVQEFISRTKKGLVCPLYEVHVGYIVEEQPRKPLSVKDVEEEVQGLEF